MSNCFGSFKTLHTILSVDISNKIAFFFLLILLNKTINSHISLINYSVTNLIRYTVSGDLEKYDKTTSYFSINVFIKTKNSHIFYLHFLYYFFIFLNDFDIYLTICFFIFLNYLFKNSFQIYI